MSGGNDIQFGIRITGDSGQMVSAVDAGEAAFDQLNEKLEETRGATASLAAQGRSLSDVIAKQNAQMAQSVGLAKQSQVSTAAHLDAQRKLDDELTRFLAVTDKAYAVQVTFQKGVDLLERSLAAGVLTQAQYDARLAALTARFGPAGSEAQKMASAHNGIGVSAGFAARETRALADELAAGRTGQAIGTFTNIAGRIAMVNPAAVAAAVGVLALGGAFLYTVAQAEGLNRSLAQTEAILIATGRGGQISEAQLQQTIQQLDRLKGISRADAEAIVASFARMQQIGPDLFGKLTAMVGDFAAATGEAAPKAAKQLADAFEDPIKGAKTLDQQFNLLTADQLVQLDAMKRTGDIVGAQELLYDALKGRITGLHEQALTPMQRAAEGLGRAWKDMTQTLGDSTVVKGTITLWSGFLTLITKMIDVLPQLAERAKQAAISAVPGGPIWATILAVAAKGSSSTTPPTQGAGSGSAAAPGSGSAANTDQFEREKKALLELTAGYETASRRQQDMAQTSARLRTVLIEMEQAGQQNTAAYAKLKDALDAINEKSAPSFENRIALITRSLQLQQAAAQQEYTITKDTLDREARELQAAHQAQLVSDQTFLARKLSIQREEAAARIAELDREIQAEADAYAKIASAHPNNQNDAARQQADLEASQQRLLKLTTARTAAEADLNEVITTGRLNQLALDEKIFDAEGRISQQVNDFITRLKEEDEEQKFQLTLIGQSEEAQARLTAERQKRLEIEREIDKLLRQIAAEEQKGANANPQVIQTLTDSVTTLKNGLPVAVHAAGDLAAQTAVASQNASDLKNAWQSVDNFLFTMVSNFRGNWRGMVQYARDQLQQVLVRYLYELTLQKFAISIFANITGAGAGTFAGSSATSSLANSAASNLIGSTIGGYAANSALGLVGGSTAITAGGFGGAAAAGVDSFLINNGMAAYAGIGTGFAGAIGSGAAALAGEMGVATASATAFGEAVAAAVPVIGWVVAIGLVLYSIFGGKGGGPKAGGSFQGGFDSAGNFTGAGTVPNSDNGRFFTPNQSDRQLQQFVQQEGAGYYNVLHALGGKAPNSASFGIGFDVDPAGSADNRVSSRVVVNGNVVRDVRDQNSGKGNDELQAALTLEAKRDLLAALQASDLPPAIADILDSLDVNKASSQAIDDALALASTFASILQQGQRDFVKDAQDLYTASTRTTRQALQAQGQALIDLANKFDGSATAAKNLADAQNAYYQSLTQLLAGIKQMKADLDSAFAQTREHIQTAGLTPDQTYQYLLNKADTLYAELQQATSPEQVQTLAKEINDAYNQAFDLLSPSQQNANRSAFLSNIDTLTTAVHNKLDEIGKAIAAEAGKPFDVVADKLGEAAEKIAAAADSLNAAANNLNGGSGAPGSSSSSSSVVVFSPVARRREAGV